MSKERFKLTPRQEQILELFLIGFYFALTAFGVAMAVGLLWPDLVFANPSDRFPGNGVYVDLFVPPHIYLFSFLGALAHVFITLFLFPIYHDKRVDFIQLVEASVRIPLAVLLSTALFLLTELLGFNFSGRTLAGISFLVGLYVKETVMAFVAVVERLFKTGEGPDLGEFYWGWWPGRTESEVGESAILRLPESNKRIPLTVRLRSTRDGMLAPFVAVRDRSEADAFTEADRKAVTSELASGEPAILEVREGGDYRVFPSIEWSSDAAGNIVVEAVVIEEFVIEDD